MASDHSARMLSIAILLLVFAGEANAYCSAPSAPTCATRFGNFESEDDFSDCRRKMEYYLSEVEDHSQCQSRIVEEAERKIEEAKREAASAQTEITTAARDAQRVSEDYGSAVEAFNRSAR